jgi:Tol biopolymer transport system component
MNDLDLIRDIGRELDPDPVTPPSRMRARFMTAISHPRRPRLIPGREAMATLAGSLARRRAIRARGRTLQPIAAAIMAVVILTGGVLVSSLVARRGEGPASTTQQARDETTGDPADESVKDAQPAAGGSLNGVISYASVEQQVFWTVRPDGTDLTRVHVGVPGFVGRLSRSPDGTRIVFDVNSFEDPHPEGGNSDIYTANADGSDPTRLTFEQVDHSPVWSPDGSRIAYVHGYYSGEQIWVMNADGSDPHQVTDRKGPNLTPSWSPDGSKIAFKSFNSSNADIYVMNADGSDVRRLTDGSAHESQPAWSPDGRQIAFTSEGAGSPGIYVMSPDGAGVTQLLDDPDPANLGFAWSPDGTKMAVVSSRGPGYDRGLYLLDVATGELNAIGERAAYSGPSW